MLGVDWLFGTARILDFGRKKYDAYNWAKGMAWSRVFSALMRHMWKWWRGEAVDAETGESHLLHASCCLMFLYEYSTHRLGTDDRPTYAKKIDESAGTESSPTVRLLTRQQANELLSGRNPETFSCQIR